MITHGITVNSIQPGLIEVEWYFEKVEGYDRDSWAQRVPLGRVGYPHDIAGAVISLASPDADYITGTALRVEGGIMTRNPYYPPGQTTTYPNLRPH